MYVEAELEELILIGASEYMSSAYHLPIIPFL